MFTFADEIQHTLLWLASDLSEEIMQLAWSNATAFRISPSENASEVSTLAIAAQVAATRPRSKKTGSAEVSESEHA
ncbi:hypothetical protein [Paraburkholderia phosphatilytica]|uniref:hypothetical protein n=1 Tax=Paraburkholderia phosphatilytica TaxID=2282883 RepID=UPI000F5E4986|nr:hypothetical protein [Paraburkholderia phosphatilytica]